MWGRLVIALLLTSLASLGVLAVGTVIPHFLASQGHREAIEPAWLVGATVLAVLTAVTVSFVVSLRLVAPLNATIDMARSFARGDTAARVPDSRRPELADLRAALNAAAAEVERSGRARRGLMDEIAHELRTPLTVLRAGLEELRDGLVPADHEVLSALHDQATRLSRLVEDLGQLSAAESVGLQLSLARVDLSHVAELAVAAREGSVAAAGLTVEADLPEVVLVMGDVDRLHQVVGNLLANSVLYCRPGDRISVRVRAEDATGVIEVADTGPGLTPDELDHAFDRAWRGGAARGTQGSGLGLAIVRTLVVAHGGVVTISSPPGAGTVVTVALPLAPPSPTGPVETTRVP